MKRLILIFIILASSVLGKTYEVKDVYGEVHKLNRSCSRIISLYPSHTEVLVGIGAGDALVGTTMNEDLKDLKSQGMTEFKLGDSVEKFIGLKPDLVLVRPMVENKYRNLIAILKSRGVEVISLHPKTGYELEDYWLALGRLSGNEEGARRYIEEYRERLARLREQGEKRRVKAFFEARYSRGLYTNAENSIASYVLEVAGVENILEERSDRGSTIVPIKHEELLSRGGEIDLYIAQKGVMNQRDLRDIEASSGYKLIRGVREGRILLVDEKTMSRPTSKILDAVEEIERYIEEYY